MVSDHATNKVSADHCVIINWVSLFQHVQSNKRVTILIWVYNKCNYILLLYLQCCLVVCLLCFVMVIYGSFSSKKSSKIFSFLFLSIINEILEDFLVMSKSSFLSQFDFLLPDFLLFVPRSIFKPFQFRSFVSFRKHLFLGERICIFFVIIWSRHAHICCLERMVTIG